MRFRPCIDLHDGKVKQIVGSTLTGQAENLRTNFVADQPPSYFAALYKKDNLPGGHVIMLGPGNEAAAEDAFRTYPAGLQAGGGITAANAADWLDKGASAVIVTSYVFHNGKIHQERLQEMVRAVGRDHLVLDLSCRKRGDCYYIVTDRWQKFTEVQISRQSLEYFAGFCCEFLIHAADVEGKCGGIAADLVADLGRWVTIPTTYAGGVRNLDDLYLVRDLADGNLDATVGSALDIFGGSGIRYSEAVDFHRRENS